MKVSEIAKLHGIDKDVLHSFVRVQKDVSLKASVLHGTIVNDEDVETLVENFRRDQQRRAQEAEQKAARLADKQAALTNMLITSGFSFDGYTVTKYSGYISGDDVIRIARTGGWFSSDKVGDRVMDALVVLRRNALVELKEAAYALGCNAVIGVDFDYLTMEPVSADLKGSTMYQPYLLGVTANGNAVVLEKTNLLQRDEGTDARSR